MKRNSRVFTGWPFQECSEVSGSSHNYWVQLPDAKHSNWAWKPSVRGAGNRKKLLFHLGVQWLEIIQVPSFFCSGTLDWYLEMLWWQAKEMSVESLYLEMQVLSWEKWIYGLLLPQANVPGNLWQTWLLLCPVSVDNLWVTLAWWVSWLFCTRPLCMRRKLKFVILKYQSVAIFSLPFDN